MNERIRELFGQALDTAVPYTWHNLDHAEVEKVMKQFAELIMRETFDWVVENVGHMEDPEWQALKRHFGVEQ